MLRLGRWFIVLLLKKVVIWSLVDIELILGGVVFVELGINWRFMCVEFLEVLWLLVESIIVLGCVVLVDSLLVLGEKMFL